MTIIKTILKDPDAVLSYGLDWADGGANDGASTDTGWLQADTILTSTWAITGPDASLIDASDSSTLTTTTVASVKLSGGTAGRVYLATNHIITTNGEEDERSLQIKVIER